MLVFFLGKMYVQWNPQNLNLDEFLQVIPTEI